MESAYTYAFLRPNGHADSELSARNAAFRDTREFRRRDPMRPSHPGKIPPALPLLSES